MNLERVNLYNFLEKKKQLHMREEKEGKAQVLGSWPASTRFHLPLG